MTLDCDRILEVLAESKSVKDLNLSVSSSQNQHFVSNSDQKGCVIRNGELIAELLENNECLQRLHLFVSCFPAATNRLH